MPSPPDAPQTLQAQAALDAHLVMLRGYARHLLRAASDADDLVQDVCVAVLSNPDLALRGSDLGAYLRGVARHLASQHHRRRRRSIAFEDAVEAVWDAAPPAEHDRERTALGECLSRLNERARGWLMQRYADGLTSDEIAARAARTGTAVRMALSRARVALGRCIRERLARARP